MGDRNNQLWPAPMAYGPVDVTVTPLGSKPIMNRALILASLATAPSRIRRPRMARDSRLLAAGLRALGARIEEGTEEWRVTPATLTDPGELTFGLDPTLAELVAPMAALVDGDVSVDGGGYLPGDVTRAVFALRDAGVTVDEALGRLDRSPLVIRGKGHVSGGRVKLDVAASPQLVSGLLLAGARYEWGVTVGHRGGRVESIPDVEMTVAMLRERGVRVDRVSPAAWQVHPGPISGLDMVIDPDLCDATPFLAAAMVTGGRARVPDWPASSTVQLGELLRGLLTRMGATCVFDEGLTVSGTGRVHGVDADLRGASELTPVLAALAAQADGPSHLRGIADLRARETNWLVAIATAINAVGGDVTPTDDGLTVRPRPLAGGVIRSHGNHRMAQAAAVLGLAVPGIQVSDIGASDPTMDEFTNAWTAMLRLERAA